MPFQMTGTLIIIGLAAIGLASLPELQALGLSALPLAILMGIIWGNLRPSELSHPDTQVLGFAQQKLLRLGIILFGFNVSFQQIAELGYQVILIDVVVISTVLLFGIWFGIKVLKMPLELTVLTSIGSAVCGAAAVMAAEPVVKAKEQDVTVAVATVVLFGTLALFSYPLVYNLMLTYSLPVDPADYGIFIGSTVHEVAQAVAAGQGLGDQAMRSAIVTKLVRVMLLAPVILLIGQWLLHIRLASSRPINSNPLNSRLVRQENESGPVPTRVPVPWFVFGFIATATLNSLLTIPAGLMSALHWISIGSLAIAMAALGYKAHWRLIRQAGIRPVLLALVLFLILMTGGFLMGFWFYF